MPASEILHCRNRRPEKQSDEPRCRKQRNRDREAYDSGDDSRRLYHADAARARLAEAMAQRADGSDPEAPF